MTYLILRFSTMSNVAMTVPVIASLSRRYPEDTFVIAAKKDLRAMFFSMPNVVFHEVDNHLDWNGVFALWRELKDQVDAVIDLQDVPRTRVLTLLMGLSGKRIARVHYGRLRKHLITVWGIGHKQLRSEFDRYKSAFRRIGLQTDGVIIFDVMSVAVVHVFSNHVSPSTRQSSTHFSQRISP